MSKVLSTVGDLPGYVGAFLAQAAGPSKVLKPVSALTSAEKAIITGASVNASIIGSETYVDAYDAAERMYLDQGKHPGEAKLLAMAAADKAADQMRIIAAFTGGFGEAHALTAKSFKDVLSTAARNVVAEVPEELAQSAAVKAAGGEKLSNDEMAEIAALAAIVGGGTGASLGALSAISSQRDSDSRTIQNIQSAPTIEDAIDVATREVKSTVDTQSKNKLNRQISEQDFDPSTATPVDNEISSEIQPEAFNDSALEQQISTLEPVVQPAIAPPSQGESIYKGIEAPINQSETKSLIDANIGKITEDRRQNLEKRNRIESIKEKIERLGHEVREGKANPKELLETVEQLRFEQTNDSVTGLSNRAAFNEHVADNPNDNILFGDIDDFKSYNTKYGHSEVDAKVLPAIGKAMREVAEEMGMRAFRRTGDEFLSAGTSEQLQKYGNEVQKRLADAIVMIELPGGSIIEHKGIGFSFGVGKNESTAEQFANQQKKQRKAAGLRSGERDVISETGTNGRQDQGNYFPGQGQVGAQHVNNSEDRLLEVDGGGEQSLSNRSGTVLPESDAGIDSNAARDAEARFDRSGKRNDRDTNQAATELIADLDSALEQAPSDEGVSVSAPKKPPRVFTAKRASDLGYIDNVSQINEFNSLIKKAHSQGHEFAGENIDQLREITQEKPNEETQRQTATEVLKHVDLNDPSIKFSKTKQKEPVFYSQLQRAATSLKQEKGTADQFLSQIKNQPGVKAAELEWTGLEEYLRAKGPKKVTKQEIVDFLDNNGVHIEEVTKSEQYKIITAAGAMERFASLEDAKERINQEKEWIEHESTYENGSESDGFYGIFDSEGNELFEFEYFEDLGIWKGKHPYLDWADASEFETFSEVEDHASEIIEDHKTFFYENLSEKPQISDSGETSSKYQDYQLSGGQNYREVLLKLPVKLSSKEEAARKIYGESFDELTRTEQMNIGLDYNRGASESFKSSHFDEPNILAHIRLNDRVDANGNVVLFVEEIQSDWAQSHRKAKKTILVQLDAKIAKLKTEGRLKVKCP